MKKIESKRIMGRKKRKVEETIENEIRK